MKRPVLMTLSLPGTVTAGGTFEVILTAEDEELIYGTDERHASEEAEVYAGEEGII